MLVYMLVIIVCLFFLSNELNTRPVYCLSFRFAYSCFVGVCVLQFIRFVTLLYVCCCVWSMGCWLLVVGWCLCFVMPLVVRHLFVGKYRFLFVVGWLMIVGLCCLLRVVRCSSRVACCLCSCFV